MSSHVQTHTYILATTKYFWFGLFLCVAINSCDYVGMVSSPDHTFFLGKLEEALHTYFCLTFYLFSPTCLINSIKYEHSCKILYIKDSCLEYPEHMGLYRRKPILGACEQHRCRPDCRCAV